MVGRKGPLRRVVDEERCCKPVVRLWRHMLWKRRKLGEGLSDGKCSLMVVDDEKRVTSSDIRDSRKKIVASLPAKNEFLWDLRDVDVNRDGEFTEFKVLRTSCEEDVDGRLVVVVDRDGRGCVPQFGIVVVMVDKKRVYVIKFLIRGILVLDV